MQKNISPLSNPRLAPDDPALVGAPRSHAADVPSNPALSQDTADSDPTETQEWEESLDAVLDTHGPERAGFLLRRLVARAQFAGTELATEFNTPYFNTVPRHLQPEYPGDRDLERKIKSIVRWNAMAMVVRANNHCGGIGGHISTFASAATLYEVAFNHIFRGRNENQTGDFVFIQGHASPGIYARAFLEGRLTQKQLENFRREMAEGGGLSSYPHPWLMQDFWQFPTVSMGLTSLQAIYQARFNEYLKDRGIVDTSNCNVWAFLGDGEMDEPESLGGITLASRERLGNLKFVVNCNLQRLDGPVRGNGKIVQELEAAFRGAGWNVIKCLWASDWDELLENDHDGLLLSRMNETVDGQFQKYLVAPGSYVRQDFFGKYPELARRVEHMSDDEIRGLRRGGHDPVKVYAAYAAALQETQRPTVILAQTVKGYGLGEAGEARNVTHQQKKLTEDQLRTFRDRFDLPIPDAQVAAADLYRPADNSPEIEYLHERRRALGGYLPSRVVKAPQLQMPAIEEFAQFMETSGEREVSTTMVFVQLLAKLLKNKEIGKRIVPIVPDEARTFGMEALFRAVGIYAHAGQLYEPVDSHLLLYYKEAQDGQILEEGLTEAGSMMSFISAGTSYATLGETMIPFYIYYSMFGFQRIGDVVWSCADQRGKGFLFGATAGRTTLNGEGLQHQDGHSHVLASTVPNLVTYDPAYAFELAVIIHDGLRRMYGDNEDIFYYITLHNENYQQPTMPEGAEEGILRGMYHFTTVEADKANEDLRVNLFGSGSILGEALRAAEILREYGVTSDVWSVTSYNELRRDALACDRFNLLNPAAETKVPWASEQLADHPWPIVAASDNMKSLPHSITDWLPQPLHALGTDGFGRSESREVLRDFFEMDSRHIAFAALRQLQRQGTLDGSVVQDAMKRLEINPDKVNPHVS